MKFTLSVACICASVHPLLRGATANTLSEQAILLKKKGKEMETTLSTELLLQLTVGQDTKPQPLNWEIHSASVAVL